MNKLFIIMRGLPGSGKTKRAREIAEKAMRENTNSVAVLSIDDYFMGEDGEYHFDKLRLTEFHAANFRRAVQHFSLGTELVILDNSNLRKSHFMHYIRAARLFQYNMEQVVVGSFTETAALAYHERCIHNVPLDIIRRGLEQFEEMDDRNSLFTSDAL